MLRSFAEERVKPQPEREPLLTYAQVEQWLGLTERTLRRRVKEGSLRAVRLGSCVRFRVADIEAFIADNVTEGR